MTTTQTGPRDIDSVLASRLTLTPLGWAATATRAEAVLVRDAVADAGHPVTVTETVFGRTHVECPCGHHAIRASKHAGNLAGLTHAIEVLR